MEAPTLLGRVVTVNTIMSSDGGSYSARSFLRSGFFTADREEGTVMLVFSRGTGNGDQKVIVQEVGTGRIMQVRIWQFILIFLITNTSYAGNTSWKTYHWYQTSYYQPTALPRSFGWKWIIYVQMELTAVININSLDW